MNNMMGPMIVAVAVALVVYSAIQFLAPMLSGGKRKLAERLSNTTPEDVAASVVASTPRNITRQTQIKGLSGKLVRLAPFERLNRSLMHSFPDVNLARFLIISGGIGVTSLTLIGIVSSSLLLAGVACGIGTYIPFFLVGHRRNKRQRIIAEQLPEALDFLSRVLRAGHSLSTGLQMMGEELPQPLAGEFRRCYDQHSLGQSLEDSLKDMVTRIESTDFAFFVTAVLIQRQTGGDLSEVLSNIGGMIRQRIRLQQHVKAKTAEGRFTGYILVAFPAVLFLIVYQLNPDYAGTMLKDRTGVMLLGTAFVLQMLGLFSIRKITTLRV